MRISFRVLVCVVLSMCFYRANAQNSEEARAIIKEGRALNDAGKYAEAIEKYNQALKVDTGNLYANFQIAYSFFQMNRGTDGIPYIAKVIKGNINLSAGAYDLLGSIYDKNHQTKEAIEAYKEGIKANPDFQRLYYNLGIVYFRVKQYADAEKCAIDAIRLDPKHASSQRMYALVTFHQNKRAEALLGLCNFMLLEPNTARSAEAYGNIQHILTGGVLKAEPGVIQAPLDARTVAFNQAILNGIADAAKTKYASPADQLTGQLNAIFINVGTTAEKQDADSFFGKYLAAYFYQLAQSPNLPAFARLISQSNPESAQWVKANPQKMTDFDYWVKGAARAF